VKLPNINKPRDAKIVARWRTLPALFMGTFAFGAGLYITSIVSNASKPNLKIPDSRRVHEDSDLTPIYDATARSLDSTVDTPEWLMGMNSLRRKLTRQAQGDVLEVSVGTGRNGKWYDNRSVRSLTCVDKSEAMLAVAREKWEERQSGWGGRRFRGEVRWVRGSAVGDEGQVPGPPRRSAVVGKDEGLKESAGLTKVKLEEEEGYDAVIQTMGLCSTPQPAALVQNLGRLVKPTTGRILLLEHGRSYWDWLNRWLDNSAENHAQQHGCWWNRDIGKIIEESGLELVKMKRYHFGTTWWVELKPGKWRIEDDKRKADDVQRRDSVVEVEKPTAGKRWSTMLGFGKKDESG